MNNAMSWKGPNKVQLSNLQFYFSSLLSRYNKSLSEVKTREAQSRLSSYILSRYGVYNSKIL